MPSRTMTMGIGQMRISEGHKHLPKVTEDLGRGSLRIQAWN